MSVSRWRYNPEICDRVPCCGDCDECSIGECDEMSDLISGEKTLEVHLDARPLWAALSNSKVDMGEMGKAASDGCDSKTMKEGEMSDLIDRQAAYDNTTAKVARKQILIIKCTHFTHRNEEEAVREKIIEQMKDGVAMVPMGYEALTVDADQMVLCNAEAKDGGGA